MWPQIPVPALPSAPAINLDSHTVEDNTADASAFFRADDHAILTSGGKFAKPHIVHTSAGAAPGISGASAGQTIAARVEVGDYYGDGLDGKREAQALPCQTGMP